MDAFYHVLVSVSSTFYFKLHRCAISIPMSGDFVQRKKARKFSFKAGMTLSRLAHASLIAVTTAACRSSSRIVRAGQSIPLFFFSTLLMHRHTVDFLPLLFHLILR
jgi:hypothetical protein